MGENTKNPFRVFFSESDIDDVAIRGRHARVEPSAEAAPPQSTSYAGMDKFVKVFLIFIIAVAIIAVLVNIFFAFPAGSNYFANNVTSSSESAQSGGDSSQTDTLTDATHRYSYVINGPYGQYLDALETISSDSYGIVSQVTISVHTDEGQEALVLNFLESQFSERILESASGDGVVEVRLDASQLGLTVSEYEAALAQSVTDFQIIGE